jgi:hypothetical protein
VNGVADRTFDRLTEFDERSRSYPIRAAIVETKFRSYTWRCLQWNNQGVEGACVGHSWSHEISARPVEIKVGTDVAQKIYKRAQELDAWVGENYEGTSVIAGAKACSEFGYIGEYRWAFSLDDLRLAVGYRGPAVLGINWTEDMFDTDGSGYLHATGEVMGGHAILCNGVSEKRKCFRLHNSWGRGWGIEGEALISFDDLGRLLAAEGEACIPVQRLNIGKQ